MKKINKKELHEIFEDLRNKNQEAYNKLYENYYSLVYGIVFSIIKNKDDSEDITHEIFTKIYKLDKDKLPTNNEASWLFTVSKNECFMYFRKVKPNISIDEVYEMPSSANDIDNVVDSEYYNKLMEGLKDDERTIVSLKVLSNFTFKKISQVMNIPIGTVQWKYYNAINSLKISIGSLAGAIIAFVVVFSRGEFWKEKQYLNENREVNEDEVTDNTSELVNDENQLSINSENDFEKEDGIKVNEESTETESNLSENSNEGEKENVDSQHDTNNVTIKDTNEESLNMKTSKDYIFQSVFLTFGIVFLITFVISLKIYKQKLKRKHN